MIQAQMPVKETGNLNLALLNKHSLDIQAVSLISFLLPLDAS